MPTTATATVGASHEARQSASILATLSVLIGVVMLLTLTAGIIGGMFHAWTGQVAMLILASIPVCTLGTALAIISLVWRKESRSVGQLGLWLNGMLAFFGVPMLVFWLLA